uniref:Uncharacterized protein n=1 Tax=Octopus bimaculoides TaxID=37653 RepID=A0A0L8G6G0_OCTBM
MRVWRGISVECISYDGGQYFMETNEEVEEESLFTHTQSEVHEFGWVCMPRQYFGLRADSSCLHTHTYIYNSIIG